MQVVAGAVAGTAYITYNLPCRYRFPCGNGSLRHKEIITSHSFCVSLCRYFLIPSHISLDSTLSSIGFISVYILPRVHGFNIAADKGLHSREGVLDDPFLRILARLNL